jgi:hypothetical protein
MTGSEEGFGSCTRREDTMGTTVMQLGRWVFGAALIVAMSLSHSHMARAQDSGFGLGIIVGDPTGLSFKGYVGPTAAIEGAVGFGFLRGNHVHAHLDFLWEVPLTSFERANLVLHFGVGPKVGFFDELDRVRVGARAPVGLTFQFTRVPLDVFLEVAAGMWIVDDLDFDLDAAAGVRYWF